MTESSQYQHLRTVSSAPALNSRPAFKSPWISEHQKSPWIVLEKSGRSCLSINAPPIEAYKKAYVRACGFIYLIPVASDGQLRYLRIIHMFCELPALGLVAVKLVEELLRPFVNKCHAWMPQIGAFSWVPLGLYTAEWSTGRRALNWPLNEKALKSLEFFGLLAQEPWLKFFLLIALKFT